MILTPAEHAEVLRQLPGPIYLTVQGDPAEECGEPCPGSSRVCEREKGHEGRHETTLHGNIGTSRAALLFWTGDKYPVHDECGSPSRVFVAPSRFVEATGPCETCEGRGVIKHHIVKPHVVSVRYADPCASCEGTGRKRAALAMTCPTCKGDHEHGHHLVGTWNIPHWEPCHKCANGSVVFAHATVEVLPVVMANDWRQHHDRRVVVFESTGRCGVMDLDADGAQWLPKPLSKPFILDSLPVPGRDWIVVLDGLVLA